MAASFDGDEVALTGTTPVEVVPDPGASNQVEVTAFVVWNRDSAVRIITAYKVGGAITPFELGSTELGAGKKGAIPTVVGVVLTNGQTIEAASDDDAATTEPAVQGSWFKVP